MSERVIMDNRKIDVISAGRDHLDWALRLLSNGLDMTHWLVEGGQLVLFWTAHPEARELLFPLSPGEEQANWVWAWLERKAVPAGESLGFQDVRNERGAFRVYCNEWGRDPKYERAFGRVEARYAWIGK